MTSMDLRRNSDMSIERADDSDSTESDMSENEREFWDQLQWIRVKLGHHVIQKQSIYFILDFEFEYYWHGQSCREFIW